MDTHNYIHAQPIFHICVSKYSFLGQLVSRIHLSERASYKVLS